jgi:outer membrane receptor protein involved in Fe transport
MPAFWLRAFATERDVGGFGPMTTSSPGRETTLRKISYGIVLGLMLLGYAPLYASIFGSVRGLIHDPQHRPVAGAQVTITAEDSHWTKTVASDDSGEFGFDTVPLGKYVVEVDATGFAPQEQKVTLQSGRELKLHFPLTVASASETVEVNETAATVNTESSTTSTVIGREDIAHTPGADQTNSLAMITNYVPGAYMVHDQLHIRGGHQVDWLVDGVPVPNTNIASNVGPQFDPKDIDSLEVQRGGYSAEYGDRTYGVFNVVTRSGFERNREGELVASYGNYNNTNDQISFGDHSERFAYYGSFSGYRTDLGLETPVPSINHDQAAGLSGFGSLIFNKTPNDQLRLIVSGRGDHYQVPVDPEQDLAGNISRDVEDERDTFVNFSWLHTAGPGAVLTFSPFYHFNRAHYVGNAIDTPIIPDDDRGSNYFGGVTSLAITRGDHNAHIGLQVFGQRDNEFFRIATADGSNPTVQQRVTPWGHQEAIFLEDQYKATNWLTFNGGLRLTHFSGQVVENAADPRIGTAVRVPMLGWVFRAFWGNYYQAPPLATVAGPVLNLAASQGFGFLPLRGERDQQREFGVTVPVRGWTIDLSNFRTSARNFFDHDVLGNSNIFFPLTIDRVRIRGWEATLNSPRLAGRLTWHLAYSNQVIQGIGGVTGGLTDFTPPEEGYFFLDHDQRTTLSTGFNVSLPWHVWTSGNLSHGSGFLNGDGPFHLPRHTTFDWSLGKSFAERWRIQFNALNITNSRYLLDQSNTFGGTHYVNPREISVQVKYRFKY